jgi:tRNA threonylcarbamoyladenosine modification (KEOPS) complex  Pcc1 subunit
MQTVVEIDTRKAEQIHTVLAQSLDNTEKIGYRLEGSSDLFRAKIDTESLGQLRGCTDTVFRLATLSKKILER